MTQISPEILATILLPLVGGGIGFLLKRYLDKKRELFNENAKERRQAYQDFINIIVDIFSQSDSETAEPFDIKRLYEFYKRNVLFAPPNVVNAFGNYMQFIYIMDSTDDNQNSIHMKKLSEVVKEMRRDLGLSNSDLGPNGEKLLRAIIKDFDNYFK